MDQLRYDLSERIRKQELFGFLEIGPEVARFERGAKTPGEARDGSDEQAAAAPPDSPRVIRYQSNSATYDAFKNWAVGVLNKEVQRERFDSAMSMSLRPNFRNCSVPCPWSSKGLPAAIKKAKIKDAPDENQIASSAFRGA